MCTFGYLDSKVNGLKNLKILFLKAHFNWMSKSKFIVTTANQNKGKYHKEPMRIRHKNATAAISAGKREWLNSVFRFRLVEMVARVY